MRCVPDVKPYLRGLICEFGYEIVQIPFAQQSRKAGKTKFSLADLIDTAMTGLVNQMRVPLRLVTYLGVVIFMISFVVAFYYFFPEASLLGQLQLWCGAGDTWDLFLWIH